MKTFDMIIFCGAPWVARWLFGFEKVEAFFREHWLEYVLLGFLWHIARRLEWLTDQVWELGEPLREKAREEGEWRKAMRDAESGQLDPD